VLARQRRASQPSNKRLQLAKRARPTVSLARSPAGRSFEATTLFRSAPGATRLARFAAETRSVRQPNAMTTISLPSVQSLLLELAFGDQPLATGTGFVCQSKKGPLLITNWHNVTGRNPQTKKPLSPTGAVPDTVRIIHNRSKKLGQWLQKTEPLTVGGNRRWVEHPVLGDRADVVALPLLQLDDVELYPYDPVGGPAIAINPAEPISVVGFPFGIQAGGSLAVWATGFVASEPQIDFDGLPVFLIDCRARPGQSGSAVIAHRNGGMVALQDGSTAVFSGPVTKLFGVYSGRINEQSDLGLVWKASLIAELVGSV